MPGSDAYLGIDLGTTALKVALFEAPSGKLIAAEGYRLETRVLPGGRREQKASDILAALSKTLARLRNASGARWARIAGIGLASQGGSAVIADKATGKALTPLWPWNDSAPLPYMPRVAELLPRGFWRRRTMRDEPGAGLGRMLWLKETRPHLLSGENIYAGAGEYVYFHLTETWRQDAGNAIQAGCYDSRRRALMSKPLEAIGIRPDFVAPMRDGHSLMPLAAGAARRFKLPAGIPVAGAYMDHEAGYMAAAGVSERPLQCSLGTAWVGNFLMDGDAAWTSPFQLVIPSPDGADWQVVQPLLTGNVSWDWGLAAFADRNRRKALVRAARIFRRSRWPSSELVCIPWLARPNPFVEGSFGAGVFHGVEPATSADDLLRALAAGMVFEFYRIFAEVHEQRAVDSIVLGGGAAGAAYFRTAFAALFAGLPVYTFADGDSSGARGALLPFGLSGAPVTRVAAPAKKLTDEASRRFQAYLKVFDAIYGGVPCAAPIRLGKS